jgi:HPt (histidine-containing phosphotransfer) domain-containing protein
MDTHSSVAVLDYAEAVKRLDGQSELFGMVAMIFVEDCPKNLEAIREAVEQRDAAALAFSAHKFKGALGALAAHPAKAAALRLESCGRAGDLDHARETLRELEQRLDDLMPELQKFIG